MIDDGVPSRGHRTNILKDAFKTLGTWSAGHKIYRSETVLDYAGGMDNSKPKKIQINYKCPSTSGKAATTATATAAAGGTATPATAATPSKDGTTGTTGKTDNTAAGSTGAASTADPTVESDIEQA